MIRGQMGNDNVIEFNGKCYDAITGKLLGKSHSEVAEPLASATTLAPRTIDGVVRRKAMEPVTVEPHVTKPMHTHIHLHRKAGKPTKAHQPQPAKTLMRRAVHKPKTSIKPAIKPQAPAEIMAKPISAVALKHSVSQIDPARKNRAIQTPKSQAVRRFASHVQHAPVTPVVVPHHHVRTAETHRTSSSSYVKPDIFEAAIARAGSHNQPKAPVKHRKRHRAAGVFAIIAAVLVLAGVVSYLNLNTLKLKVASMQAGFSAQMPSYKPTGYVLGAVTTTSGNVTMNFRSGEKHYQLTQQPTNWNSQTLGDDIIASAGAKTIESHGRIIYIYDNTASWVSGGVRYDLTGNAELDEDDIAAIAASM